jgi:hypothetical protein
MAGLSLLSASPADGVSLSEAPQRLRDNLGKFEVSEAQNLFEADFEYSAQPMRWEQYISGSASITQISGQGGIQMAVTGAAGDAAIRQTRPYIRYQPGKTIYMSSGFVFGTPYTNQRQRVGFFDDGNGIFFEQGDPTSTNPSGMGVVYRSDVGGVPFDTRTSYENWSDPQGIKSTINWNQIQMIWIEFAWYGAGLLRWGVVIGGEPYTLHQIGIGNKTSQTTPWSRTGNIPVRYELRNIGPSTAGSMYHYGVSVLAKGRIDTQRGFTYGYGMAANTPTRSPGASATRYPLLTIRYRPMGTLEYGVNTNYSGSNGTLPAGGSAISAASNLAAQVGTSTISSTTLTIGTVTSGTVAVGQLITGANVAQGTVITANISGSGAGSTWTVSVSQTAASSTMYMTAGTQITTGATWTVNQWAGKYVWCQGSTSSITGIVVSGASAPYTATATTAAPHFLTSGKYLTISGGTSNTTVNGTFQITVTGPTTFTYSVTSSGNPSGTIVYTQGLGAIGRIISNTATTLTVVDNVVGNASLPYPMVNTPATSGNYIIGEIDRGQILPQTLNIFSSANCTLELIASTFYSPITTNGTNFSFNTLYSLGSLNSFAERDVSATGTVSGGEVVYNSPCPAGALQAFDLTSFFPLYTTVQGNQPDYLVVAISTPSGFSGNVGASIVAQEAMS